MGTLTVPHVVLVGQLDNRVHVGVQRFHRQDGKNRLGVPRRIVQPTVSHDDYGGRLLDAGSLQVLLAHFASHEVEVFIVDWFRLHIGQQ